MVLLDGLYDAIQSNEVRMPTLAEVLDARKHVEAETPERDLLEGAK